MEAINANTPDPLWFESVNDKGETVRLKSIRNIHFMPGIGANLTYRHPSVEEGGGSEPGVTKLPLVAQYAFSLYDKELDISKALYGPTEPGKPSCIVDQLRGMYRPRNPQMAPAVMGPPPVLRIDEDAGMQDHARIGDVQPGVVIDNPRGAVVRDVSRSNDALAPVGHRF
jgi:hypothetical protein